MKRFNTCLFVFLFIALCMLCVWSPPVQSAETKMNENTFVAVAPATNYTFEKSSNRKMPLVGVRDLRGSKSTSEQNSTFILMACTMCQTGCAESANIIKPVAHTIEDTEKAIGSGGERVYALGKTGKGEALTFDYMNIPA